MIRLLLFCGVLFLVACQSSKPTKPITKSLVKPLTKPLSQETAKTYSGTNQHHGVFKLDKNQKSEVCPELTAGQVLEFDFKASLPVLFNFHYHQDKQTLYPLPERNLTEIKYRFVAPSENFFCLMWQTHLDNTKIQYRYSISG